MKPSFSPTSIDENRLREHLESTLQGLADKLPSYNQGRLFDELCFLLRSDLYHYAISPRLQQVNVLKLRLPNNVVTPKFQANESDHEDLLKPSNEIRIPLLNVSITWDGDSWATQLRYGRVMLLEGRQYNTTQEAGFVQSFQWFCEEVHFLWYEYRARERAAAARLGTTDESRGVRLGRKKTMGSEKTRAESEGDKERRNLKLKLRLSNTGD
ncbi:Nn.00g103630.m01.CDS01 [Neocucurbitaria sp. VM-36]